MIIIKAIHSTFLIYDIPRVPIGVICLFF